jgi:hypothetical protein
MPVTINGSAGVTTNSGAVYNSIQSDTAKTATGTSVDFTSIPSWVKRITVMFSGVSTNGTSVPLVQLGDSGGIETTGYTAAIMDATSISSTYTNGFPCTFSAAAADFFLGKITINLLSGNLWVAEIATMRGAPSPYCGSGTKTLSDTLTQIRITTVNGTDTFDAGSINILFE